MSEIDDREHQPSEPARIEAKTFPDLESALKHVIERHEADAKRAEYKRMLGDLIVRKRAED